MYKFFSIQVNTCILFYIIHVICSLLYIDPPGETHGFGCIAFSDQRKFVSGVGLCELVYVLLVDVAVF